MCRKDSAGFIVSRLAAAQLAEACRLYEEGVASVEDIDRAMRLGLRHPMGPFEMGPFELADFTGLETSEHVTEGLAEVFGERSPNAPDPETIGRERVPRPQDRWRIVPIR